MSSSSPPDENRLWSALLDQLHAADVQVALVVSGGGSGSIAHCFRRSGASRTFVEAVVAYSRSAMTNYLGEPPDGSSASVETARQLSRAAENRCHRMADVTDFTPVGIALVAALPTSTPRQGMDRIHVALTSAGQTRSWSKELAEGQFTRESAEDMADEMIRIALASVLSA